jgi:hypothetical protein
VSLILVSLAELPSEDNLGPRVERPSFRYRVQIEDSSFNSTRGDIPSIGWNIRSSNLESVKAIAIVTLTMRSIAL